MRSVNKVSITRRWYRVLRLLNKASAAATGGGTTLPQCCGPSTRHHPLHPMTPPCGTATASAHSPSGRHCIAALPQICLRCLYRQCAFIIAVLSSSPSPFNQYLDDNKKLILAILDNQNLGKLAECA
ncbi:hypothetical protein PIB30_068051, partial [Stylosanthes scabra]|nr:hypothetical protein [Stylosanthes scabra]